MGFALEAFAVHRLRIDANGKTVVPVGSAAPATLAADARERIERYVDDLHDRDEAVDRAVSAWWSDGASPAHIEATRSCAPADFNHATRRAVELLSDGTPRDPRSAGIVVFLRGHFGDGAALGIVKLPLLEIEHTRFHRRAGDAGHAISVDHVVDVLPDPADMNKAALLPNPGGAPLRVIDMQIAGDPAGYWLRFLGARARPRVPRMVQLVANALHDTLLLDFQRADALDLVVGELPAPDRELSPRELCDNVAGRARIESGPLWEAAAARVPKLETTPHLAVPGAQPAARRVTVDLQGGVRVSGPADQLDRRMEIDQDAHGWYVKLRPLAGAQRPHPRIA